MLHVVTAANSHLYTRQLDEMYRHRTRLFVEGMGWNLRVIDGCERDEGDDERAVYLIAIDGDGGCCSSVRIRPVDDFSYLLDHMTAWVDEDPRVYKQDPTVWEMARWINQSPRAETSAEILIGAVEYMLGQGVTQCISCPDVDKADYVSSRGWRLRFLGAPRRYPEGGIAVGASLPITLDTLKYLRRRYDRHMPVYFEIPPDAPWAALPLTIIDETFREVARTSTSSKEMYAICGARLLEG